MTATQDYSGRSGPEVMTTRPGRGSAAPAAGGKVARSRMGGAWVALIIAAFVTLFLMIFILQNGQQAQVSFLGAHGNLPMGVALLLAAISGILLVALPGTVRILQLRALGRRTTGPTSAAGSSTARPTTPEGG